MTQPSLKLFSSAAAKRAHEVNSPHDFAVLASSGFWWCKVCQKIVPVDLSGAFTVCEKCRSPRVKWNPPVA
jgi:Zn finger protein HypA/HybF involved in hydrogenase expression